MKFENRIKEARLKAGMTQQELADRTDITVVEISRIENGKVTGTMESFYRISKALNVSLDWLCGVDE